MIRKNTTADEYNLKIYNALDDLIKLVTEQFANYKKLIEESKLYLHLSTIINDFKLIPDPCKHIKIASIHSAGEFNIRLFSFLDEQEFSDYVNYTNDNVEYVLDKIEELLAEVNERNMIGSETEYLKILDGVEMLSWIHTFLNYGFHAVECTNTL